MSHPNSPNDADLIVQIQQHNAGRDPERLSMKYAKMASSAFVFLRGACHLFYAALPDSPLFLEAPLAWCCGDLHFENVGSYKGDNRLVYFDINDYDEAALAPASWDLVRLLTSIQCGADALSATREQALSVSQSCLQAYRQALAHGKPLWVEPETSVGLVNKLLSTLHQRQRAAFLDKRTVRKGPQRLLKVDGLKALPASEAQKHLVTTFVQRFASTQPNPDFYRVCDVGRRIAGTGSLGVERFVVLIAGKGSPDGNYLLDIKEAKPSALVPHLNRLGVAQPSWPDEATRVVSVQKRMQAIDHAFLHAVHLGDLPCILKGLQPSEDRVAIGSWGKKLEHLTAVVETMGCLLAWDQLRASGRSGSANADALIAFGLRSDWAEEMLHTATALATRTNAQWNLFSQWYQQQKL